MKVLLLTLLSCQYILASSVVCSNERLYYSKIVKDYGVRPPSGSLLLTKYLNYRQQPLGAIRYFVGIDPVGVWDVKDFSISTLQQIQVRDAGPVHEEITNSRISFNLGDHQYEEDVICKSESVFVP